ncbi:hypothetical protein DFJ58DRAFT_719455 [Suillus subalutaceus]|uniref:uncharacterized protein n=1 Tax=Suillus subalutaceus TaxID=48586 RepID=UPI001B877E1A|nr:uncharacterized protein DFJ58DRAFT_719455 [Suillus subalutaceus]KAG1833219.1 hypothetical protein DFJ58DRAFT_719455 [Suillus subalutaceus]
MPILVNGYLAWRHGAPTIDDNTMMCNIFHVDAVGISGEQPNESILSPAQLHAMDGNFSAKRLDGSGSADTRLFQSQYSISEAEVDQFKDDIQRRTTILSACTENWTAAKAVDDNTITVLIECVAEMKHSGELLLDVCGADQAIGHDIACSSRKTIATSSIGAKAADLNLQVVLQNHPLYLNGLGLEDLETCEHIFTSSNSAAVLIRHASYFHWMQFLDLHFDQWDMDRYFIIKTNTPVLEDFKQLHNLMDADFISWCNEDHDYLSKVATEPTSDAITVAYVEQLEKLQYAEFSNVWSSHFCTFLTYTPANFTHTAGLNAAARNNSRAFESEHTSALCKYELQLNVVEDFERRHSIMER